MVDPDPVSTSYADTIAVPEDELPSAPDTLPIADSPRITAMLAQLGVAAPTTLDPPPGQPVDGPRRRSLGRYALGATLGRGGMGVVVEALDTELRRPVAVKTLKDPDGAGRGQLARFVAEARITGQLDHPNIIPVHDLGVSADGELFFVMKRVRGRSLRQILDELRAGEPEALAAWPPHRLLTAFLQVCQAVGYAHGRGVVHRDLKPDNIMLGSWGEVVVMDWGIARVLNGEPEPIDREVAAGEVAMSRTLDGAVIGTPGWMSPEQARGWLERVDRTSDVWSLGAILYALLTFRPPYEQTSPMRLMYLAAKGPPEDPRDRAPEFDIDPALAAVCLHALATDQEDRPPDAGALASEIEAYLAGSLASAESSRRWRAGGLVVGMLGLLVVVAGASLLAVHGRATRAEETAAAVSARAERDGLIGAALRAEVIGRPDHAAALHRAARELPLGGSGYGDLVRLIRPAALRRSLPGGSPARHLVWTTPQTVAVAYDEGITIWRVESGGAQQLKDVPPGVTHLVLLPDGALGSCGAAGPGMVWSGADGIPIGRRDLAEPCGTPLRVAGDHRGDWAAAVLPSGGVQLLHVSASAESLSGGGAVTALAFAPDGSQLAAVRMDGTLDVWTIGVSRALLADVGALGPDAYVGARNNLRVCRGDARVVAVAPYPSVTSVWADPARCGATR